MRTKLHAAFLVIGLISCIACTKEPPDSSTFSLIGTWGMESGTITDKDGTTSRYDKLGQNEYYQYLEFRTDGSFVETALPSMKASYGTYSYNDATRRLQYKYDGDKYFVPASVNILSAKEIIINTDWGTVGSMTRHMIKQR